MPCKSHALRFVLVAAHDFLREGVRVNEKIGDIRLQAGDVLLMEVRGMGWESIIRRQYV